MLAYEEEGSDIVRIGSSPEREVICFLCSRR